MPCSCEPAQHRHAGELGTVIGNDYRWTAAASDDGIKLAGTGVRIVDLHVL